MGMCRVLLAASCLKAAFLVAGAESVGSVRCLARRGGGQFNCAQPTAGMTQCVAASAAQRSESLQAGRRSCQGSS